MLLYLAHPMDYARPDPAKFVEAVAVLGSEHRLFIPGGAWQGAPGSQQRANEAVILSCDALVALWDGEPTVGVHREIGFAVGACKPVVIIGTAGTGSAHAGEVVVPDAQAALDALKTIGHRGRVGFYTGQAELRQAHPGDAGVDLYVSERTVVPVGGWANVPCSTRVKLPQGTWGMVVGRSSTFWKRGLITNPGIIDNGYTGELFVSVHNPGRPDEDGHLSQVVIEPGDRIAQLIVLPCLADRTVWQHTDVLPKTTRGDAGFGSTGS